VERHDGNATVVVTKLDVTATLSSPNKSDLGESPDCFRP